MFANLGRWCYRNRGKVLLIWLAGFVIAGGLMGKFGSAFSTQFTMPDVESRRGFDILDEHFAGSGAGSEGGTIVFSAEQGVNSPKIQTAVTKFLKSVDKIEDITVVSPYSQAGASQVASQGPSAGKIAYAQIGVPRDISLAGLVTVGEKIRELEPNIKGLEVELGGASFAELEVPSSEMLGLGFAIIVLIFAFGSVLAMGLPVTIALAGISLGTMLAGLLSHWLSIPDFSTTIGIMLGLGVGIDYALFIVTRYRENIHKGLTMENAVVKAYDTAGRAVVFAATTVVISLMGMVLMNLAFVTGIAAVAALVVATTAIGAMTLLPALLGYVEKRVEITRWRGLIAAVLVAIGLVCTALNINVAASGAFMGAGVILLASFAIQPLRKEVLRRKKRELRDTVPYRWSRFVQHHAVLSVIGGSLILLVLAMPFTSVRLGFSDEGNYPEETSTRKAYDLLASGFGPGFNGPLLLATEIPKGFDQKTLTVTTRALAKDSGVAFVTPVILNNPNKPTAALWRLFPTTSPQDQATTDLVHRLREEVLPKATKGANIDVVVSGVAAANVDFTEYLTARLLLFIGVVLALSFLLLMVVFRSLLVPLSAVVMNLLSIGAAYGVVTAIFQWGWLGGLIGIEGAPIEPFVPMMMFAILFGLSMDYEVFLLTRIHEEYLRTGKSREAVADGLASTARVISAAAIIMVVVFGSFIGESNRVVKLFGVGLASAVLIDATVVRMLLVPAIMELLGDANWWLPKKLSKLLPNIPIENTKKS